MIAWVFPGQGSQYVGMGASLRSRVALETFEVAKDVFGWDVRAACLEGPDQVLAATEVSQPAIFTVSVAAALSMQAAGLFPDVVAGHSVGEFAALVAAHAVALEDALATVAVRACAMAEAGRATNGGMAAILGLSIEDVQRTCRTVGGQAGVAAINGPAQIVVSGERRAIDAVIDAARAAGARRVVPLDVSVAAHSTLMQQAMAPLKRALEHTTILPPLLPFVSCVSGRLENDPVRISELLCEALTRPVDWVQTTHTIEEMGATSFAEVGPGRVLTGLVRAMVPDSQVTPVGDDDATAKLVSSLSGSLGR